ncbi:MAG: thioredoxin domain-containing protein [Bdellovibrionaceae bacterium]|nr:thioredoxin domain-containing protein [Pseudobdellovibrionaceae bacterium]
MTFKLLGLGLVPLLVTGCLSSEKQIQDALERNPDLIFKVIENNPEKFVTTVNSAVRKAQEAQTANRDRNLDKRIQEDLHKPKRPLLQAERTLVGVPGAEIVVVEWGDFQCPACAVGYQNFKSFKERYKDEMQFIFKHMPLDFHPMAKDAALAFELIRMDSREKAMKFYEECFAEPGAMNSEKDLEAIVKKVGYDWKTLKKSKRVPEAQKIIQADIEEFTKFGFNGTPSFIMNGVALPGAQPPTMFDKIRDLTTAVK